MLKKGCLGIVVFFAALAALGALIDLLGGGSEISQADAAPPPEQTAEEKEEARQAYLSRLESATAGLGGFEVQAHTSSMEGIHMALARFQAWVQVAEEGADLNLEGEDAERLEGFKRELGRLQQRSFPQLRDAYGPATRSTLWEHDITARTFGNGYRTIEFVGGAFAANRNKKQFQEGVQEALSKLRFRRAQYRWYKGASEYTYWEMDTPDDGALVIWRSGQPVVIE